jgi:hypothetical protein
VQIPSVHCPKFCFLQIWLKYHLVPSLQPCLQTPLVTVQPYFSMINTRESHPIGLPLKFSTFKLGWRHHAHAYTVSMALSQLPLMFRAKCKPETKVTPFPFSACTLLNSFHSKISNERWCL